MSLMINELHSSAPGKLFLSGEYAVLDGAPAVAMAMNRRVGVSAQRISSDAHEVTTQGYPAPAGVFDVASDGAIVFADNNVAQSYDLFARILGSLWRENTADIGRWRWHLNSGAFFSDGRKLGFGSSAALSIALAGALSKLLDCDCLADIAEVHRAAQSGRGSGVDLQVARHGGLLVATATPGADIQKLPWPDGLYMAVVDSGTSQSTSVALARLPAERVDETSVALQEAACRCAAAWAAADADLLAAIAGFRDALFAFDQRHQIGIFAGAHTEIERHARGLPVVYKPSGAGGGDLGVALSDDPDGLDAFISRCTDSGRKVVDARIETRGLEVVAK